MGFGQLSSFGEVLSLANEAMLCVDAHRRVVLCNQAASDLFGWSRDEIVGMPFDLLFPERYRKEKGRQPHVFADHSAIKITGDSRFRMAFLRKNGEEFKAEASVTHVTLDGGLVRVLALRNAEHNGKAQEAARLDAERLRVIVRNTPVMLAHQDRDLRYTWVHWPDAPLAVERMIGRTDAEIFEPEDARRLTEMKMHVLRAAEAMRAEVRTTIAGAAHLSDLVIEPLLSAEGDIAGIMCVSRDVTAAKRAERMQEVVRQVRAGLTETSDSEQTVTNILRAVVAGLAEFCMLELFVDGQTRRVRAAHRDRGKAACVEALEHIGLENGRGFGWEALNRRQSTMFRNVGDVYLRSVARDESHLQLLRELAPVSLIAVPLVVRKQLLGAMVLAASSPGSAFTKDDRRDAEEIGAWVALAAENARLERTARRVQEDRDETIGIVAHDLRGPLSVIENCARAIAARLRQSADHSAAHGPGAPEGERIVHGLRHDNSAGVRQILRSSWHANRLIHDLLDASRKNGGDLPIERRRVGVEKLFAEAIETHKLSTSSHPLTLEIEPAAAALKVWCDRRRIGQVLQNLLDNAVKFSPQGGPVVVHVSAPGGELLVRVSDKGQGIAPEHLQHIFERYWRGAKTQRQGTGLGLSICKEIVEAHGGRIWADSSPGAGSDFHFVIPAVTEPSQPSIGGAPVSAMNVPASRSPARLTLAGPRAR